MLKRYYYNYKYYTNVTTRMSKSWLELGKFRNISFKILFLQPVAKRALKSIRIYSTYK